MKYSVFYSKDVIKQFKKLDKYTAIIITNWISKNLIDCENPRAFGKALKGNFKGSWRYRIGDYRLICLIEDDKLIITAVNIGHRRDVYK